MKIIGFHNPDEENGYLSNWYLSEFTLQEITFTSAEQYMMYRKAILFNDANVAAKILSTDNVADIKKLGRAVRNYNEIVWNGMRQVIVFEGLLAKFSQSEELRELLLKTEDAILAECAVHDRIWGIGLSMTDENKNNMDKWRGTNLLGFSLMEVRNILRRKF